jgi:hypothetical protein
MPRVEPASKFKVAHYPPVLFVDTRVLSCNTHPIMAKATATTPAVKLTLYVPENILDIYAERAAKFGRSVEDELLLRLRDCREHNAISPIYLDDAARQELTQITGKLVRNSEDLLTWARQVTALKVEQVEVPLGQTLTTRLESRRFGAPWPEHVRNTVIRCLETEVGLR